MDLFGFCMFSLFLAYKEYNGACRNENNGVSDIGSANLVSLLDCQQKCDDTAGCGAVSWNGYSCLLTSSMATTTTETSWKCYSNAKGK